MIAFEAFLAHRVVEIEVGHPEVARVERPGDLLAIGGLEDDLLDMDDRVGEIHPDDFAGLPGEVPPSYLDCITRVDADAPSPVLLAQLLVERGADLVVALVKRCCCLSFALFAWLFRTTH